MKKALHAEAAKAKYNLAHTEMAWLKGSITDMMDAKAEDEYKNHLGHSRTLLGEHAGLWMDYFLPNWHESREMR